ncbi:MAG: tripartite tricarboxylate transporter substrate-binding protein, partial [Dehalococcoidia bacterium]|nr:tripartite tricarboxylate transporter substrate-binding protein [Dehalococcoidia bacterium]
GISGPAGMPPAIVTRLNAEIRKALKSADVRERLESDGNKPDDLDASAFTEFVRKEVEHWTPIVKMAGVKLGK